MAKYIISVQELFVKHDDQLGLGFSDDCAPGSEWNVLSQSRIEIHDSVAHSKIVGATLFQIRAAPVGETLLIDVMIFDDLYLLHFEVDCAKVALDVLVVRLKLLNELNVKGIESHFNVWQLTDRQLFNPSEHFFQVCDGNIFVLLLEVWIQIVQAMHALVFIRKIANCLDGLRIFGHVLFDDVKAFL